MDKAAFEKMMNVAAEVDDGELGMISSMLGEYFGNINFAAIFRKPEIQRLLSSELMRDAVEVSEIPALQTMYEQIYEQKTMERGYDFGFNLTYTLLMVTPIAILILLFVFLTLRILKHYKERTITQDEKKRLKQLKRENAEAQRLANLNKGKQKQVEKKTE